MNLIMDIQTQLSDIAELLIKEDINAALKRVYELIGYIKQNLGDKSEKEENNEDECSEGCS